MKIGDDPVGESAALAAARRRSRLAGARKPPPWGAYAIGSLIVVLVSIALLVVASL